MAPFLRGEFDAHFISQERGLLLFCNETSYFLDFYLLKRTHFLVLKGPLKRCSLGSRKFTNDLIMRKKYPLYFGSKIWGHYWGISRGDVLTLTPFPLKKSLRGPRRIRIMANMSYYSFLFVLVAKKMKKRGGILLV